MTFKAIFAPFWSSILKCNAPECDGTFGSIHEDGPDVREEAEICGWTCNDEADHDICPRHQEA